MSLSFDASNYVVLEFKKCVHDHHRVFGFTSVAYYVFDVGLNLDTLAFFTTTIRLIGITCLEFKPKCLNPSHLNGAVKGKVIPNYLNQTIYFNKK